MPALFVDYAFFFPFYIFCFFVKHQMFIGMWTDIQVFDSVLLVKLSVIMPVPGCFQYYSSVVDFEVMYCDASRSPFIVQDCVNYPVIFAFLYEVEYCSFEVCRRIVLGF